MGRVDEIARNQHGLISRSQLLGLGVSDHVVRRMRRERLLVATGPGAYRLVGAPSTWQQAVVAACLPGGGCASHVTALRLYGIQTGERDTINVTVVRGKRRSGTTARGITIHSTRSFGPTDVVTRGHIRLTSPKRTLLDMADTGLSVEELEVLVCELLQRRLVQASTLRAYLALPHRRHGISALRSAASTVLDGGALESPAELKMLRLLQRAGVPDPVRQYELRDRDGQFVARFDDAWPDLKVALETDGFFAHGTREAFEAARLRDLRAKELGWDVVRTSPEICRRNPDQISRTLLSRLTARGWQPEEEDAGTTGAARKAADEEAAAKAATTCAYRVRAAVYSVRIVLAA